MKDKEEGKQLSSKFIYSFEENEIAPFETLKSAYYGIRRFFAHNNYQGDSDKNAHSCGHAAIATFYDYYNKSPWRLPRNQIGIGLAHDGKMHFGDELVRNVYNRYPPTNWFSIKFTTRETILKSLYDVGIRTDESYKGTFENGEKYVVILKKWIRERRRPILVLLDCEVIDRLEDHWPGTIVPTHTYHWGFIIGYDINYVYMGSWKQVVKMSWHTFTEAWHCRNLPYPNNFYAIYT